MKVPLKKEHLICNWCGEELKGTLLESHQFGKEDYYPHIDQIDYCDDYCKHKAQKACEHNNTDITPNDYCICFDCGELWLNADLK